MGSKNSTTKPPVLSSEPMFSVSLERVTGTMLQSQFKKSVYTSLFTGNAEQSPKSTPRTEVCTGGLGQETPSRCEIQIKILDFISSLKMHFLCPPMALCLPNPFPSLLRQTPILPQTGIPDPETVWEAQNLEMRLSYSRRSE